jgi:hypothetical protein
MEQRVVYLALGNLEGKVAMKTCPPERTLRRCERNEGSRSERGQSVLLFAILMPIMSLFLLGILDYMVTNARVMETVAAADLAAHAGCDKFSAPSGGDAYVRTPQPACQNRCSCPFLPARQTRTTARGAV